MSPSAVLALDVVVQRAVYELSDKISRTVEANDVQLTPRMAVSVNNIERCVSVMSHQVIPMFTKLQKYFNIISPTVETPLHLGSRVQTLNRQLQELLAWTKYDGQNRVPQLFSKPTGDPDTPRSARVHEASLLALDELLVMALHEAQAADYSLNSQVVEAAGRRVAHLIGGGSGGSGLAMDMIPCGSLEAGLHYFEQSPEMDWISLVPDYCHQSSTKLSYEQRNEQLALQKKLESIVDVENCCDTAVKHLKACFKDVVNLVNTFADAVQSSGQDSDGMWGAALIGRSLKTLRDDAEMIVLAGEDIANIFMQQKVVRLRNVKGLAQAIAKLDEVNETLEKPDKERSSVVKKLSKSWEKPLRDAGFNQVRSVTTKTRFFQLKFVGMYPNVRQPVPSTIFVDTIVPLHSTMMLKYYLQLDSSGKLRTFFDLLRMYIKSHRICDPAGGFLSTYGWMVLALHVLFKFDYLPNLHSAVFEQSRAIIERGHVDLFPALAQLPGKLSIMLL